MLAGEARDRRPASSYGASRPWRTRAPTGSAPRLVPGCGVDALVARAPRAGPRRPRPGRAGRRGRPARGRAGRRSSTVGRSAARGRRPSSSHSEVAPFSRSTRAASLAAFASGPKHPGARTSQPPVAGRAAGWWRRSASSSRVPSGATAMPSSVVRVELLPDGGVGSSSSASRRALRSTAAAAFSQSARVVPVVRGGQRRASPARAPARSARRGRPRRRSRQSWAEQVGAARGGRDTECDLCNRTASPCRRPDDVTLPRPHRRVAGGTVTLLWQPKLQPRPW